MKRSDVGLRSAKRETIRDLGHKARQLEILEYLIFPSIRSQNRIGQSLCQGAFDKPCWKWRSAFIGTGSVGSLLEVLRPIDENEKFTVKQIRQLATLGEFIEEEPDAEDEEEVEVNIDNEEKEVLCLQLERKLQELAARITDEISERDSLESEIDILRRDLEERKERFLEWLSNSEFEKHAYISEIETLEKTKSELLQTLAYVTQQGAGANLHVELPAGGLDEVDVELPAGGLDEVPVELPAGANLPVEVAVELRAGANLPVEVAAGGRDIAGEFRKKEMKN
ncbi:hypothetical protein RCL1_003111 [Eukaryota sp. TZLM3-RCL]